MSVLRQAALKLSRHVPVAALRGAGRWMLLGPRRRALRERLSRALTEGTRTIDRGVGSGIKLSARGSNPAYAMGVAEPAVQAELARSLRPGMVFYDVGANIGFMTLIASRLVGAGGQVVAFEPLAANVELLERNLALNAVSNVRIVERALAARSGSARMAVPDVTQAGTLAFLDESETATGPEVLVSTLDDAIAELALRPPDVVKIDVEGAEVDVVAGMTETLATAGPRLLIEVHDDRDERPRERALRENLGRQGYEVVRLEGEQDGMPHLLAVRVTGG